MLTQFNKAKFTACSGAIKKSDKAMQANTQALIEMGLSHYEVSGDTGYLTKAMDILKGARTIKAQLIKDYIEKCANVRFKSTQKKGVKLARFVKQGKDVVVQPLTNPDGSVMSWYDYHAKELDAIIPTFDPMSRAKSLLTSLDKALSHGKAKDVSKAEELRGFLQQFTGVEV